MLGEMIGSRLQVALVCALAGCGDGTGTTAECGFGGALTDCPDSELTAEAACWRLVDCGAIPVEGGPNDERDWGTCVDGINDETADRERLVIRCIAAASCDELRVTDFCEVFGR